MLSCLSIMKFCAILIYIETVQSNPSNMYDMVDCVDFDTLTIETVLSPQNLEATSSKDSRAQSSQIYLNQLRKSILSCLNIANKLCAHNVRKEKKMW